MAIKQDKKIFNAIRKTTRAKTITYSASFLHNSSSYQLFKGHFHSLKEFVMLFKAEWLLSKKSMENLQQAHKNNVLNLISSLIVQIQRL